MKQYSFLLCLIGLPLCSVAQVKKASFHDDQLKEYNRWLNVSLLSANLKIDSGSTSYQRNNDTLTITLRSAYQGLDSLVSAWNSLDKRLAKERQTSVAELLHQQGAFLFDLKPQQFKILVEGNQHESFRRIYYTESIQDKRIGVLSGSPIVILIQELRLPVSQKKIRLSGKPLVKAVTQKLANELKRYYSDKPSSLFYSVQVDTSREFFNSLLYRITCLKNEITNDNYFEFIELQIDVAQQANSSVEVRLAIKGKFCAGLRCPNQREKFYYSMDGKYDGNLSSYTTLMEKRVEQWLSN